MAHLVVCLVGAQVDHVDAGAAVRRAVVAVLDPVEAAQNLPLQPAQQRIGRAEPRRVRRPTGRGAAGAHASVRTCVGDRRGSDGVVEDRVGGHPVGERLEREHDPMAQHLVGQIEHIRWQRIVATADVGECACSEDQVDRPTRADAVVDVLREATEAGLGRGRE